MKHLLKAIWKIPRKTGIFLISLYQKTLSPDHGIFKIFYPHGYCKFHPSCSEYTKLAIDKYGLFWGSIKGFWRILRCNPCSKGGLDEA